MARGCTGYKESNETAAVSHGTSRASAVSTPLCGHSKTCYKKLVTHVDSHASVVSLLESREQRYIKVINSNNQLNTEAEIRRKRVDRDGQSPARGA